MHAAHLCVPLRKADINVIDFERLSISSAQPQPFADVADVLSLVHLTAESASENWHSGMGQPYVAKDMPLGQDRDRVVHLICGPC